MPSPGADQECRLKAAPPLQHCRSMNPVVWLQYLLGQGRAIRRVAESRSALWTGVTLVLLTAMARNYDQTFIAEKPLRWLLGPLGFSVVSGTWLYAVAYGVFARWRMGSESNGRPGFWSGWRSFMGLFWMTAPIAWLYAIPVERFLEPVTAAKANIALLAVVSLWRVLLMTRVLQHLTRCRWHLALVWILFPAAVEVLVVFFLGDHLAQSLMASMGGLRNSPAEEVLISAMGSAFFGALIVAPTAILLAFESPKTPLIPLPAVAPDALPWRWLGLGAVCWIGVAIGPQLELQRSSHVERLMSEGKFRDSLDVLGAHEPGDFAPSRPLPPRPYEYEIFDYLPACFRQVRADDPAWVRSFLVRRLDEMLGHYVQPRKADTRPDTEAASIDFLRPPFFARKGLEATDLLALVNGLHRIPEGRQWLEDHPRFVEGIQKSAQEVRAVDAREILFEAGSAQEWAALEARLRELWPPVQSP